MGESVPKHTGPIVLTDTHLEPSVSRTRPTTIRENHRRWKGLIPRDTQAACRFNCLASKSTPFFQMVDVKCSNLSCQGEARQSRPHPFLDQSHIEIAEWSRPSTGR
jgi:hypothetical protein